MLTTKTANVQHRHLTEQNFALTCHVEL